MLGWAASSSSSSSMMRDVDAMAGGMVKHTPGRYLGAYVACFLIASAKLVVGEWLQRKAPAKAPQGTKCCCRWRIYCAYHTPQEDARGQTPCSWLNLSLCFPSLLEKERRTLGRFPGCPIRSPSLLNVCFRHGVWCHIPLSAHFSLECISHISHNLHLDVSSLRGARQSGMCWHLIKSKPRGDHERNSHPLWCVFSHGCFSRRRSALPTSLAVQREPQRAPSRGQAGCQGGAAAAGEASERGASDAQRLHQGAAGHYRPRRR